MKFQSVLPYIMDYSSYYGYPTSLAQRRLLWPPCVADAGIIFWPVVSSIFYFLFLSWPNLSNLGCRSETCCTRLAKNTEPRNAKKSPKIRHLGTIAQLCRAISSQLMHVLTIGKKNLLNSNVPTTCSQYCELRPTSG